MIKNKDLPNGWKIQQLGDVCLNRGEYGSGARAVEYNAEKPRYVRITDIDENGCLKNKNKVSPSIIEEKCLLQDGDLLFARSGSVGKTYLYNKNDGYCQYAGYLIRFKPNSEIIDSNYLQYLTKTPYYWNWINSKKNAVTIHNINAKKYAELKIPLPPLQTQMKIVAILEKAERLKEWRKEADELTDEFLKSTFLEMFYRSNPDYSKWEFVSIKDLTSSEKGSMRTGPFGSDLKHSEFVDTGIAVLGIDNAVNNRFQWGQRRYITDEKYNKLKRYTVYPEDVIVTIMATIGKSCVVPKDIPLSISTKHLAVITCDKTKCDPQFLSKSMLFHPEIKQQLAKANVGAIMDGLNLTIIKSLKIHFPPLTLQQKFSSIVQQVEQLREHQSKSRQHIDDLFNVLMQKAFKGELM